MLRLPPFDKIGASGPVPDHVNADPANSVQGSVLNVLIFNQLQHEAENLEFMANLNPDGTNLYQWTQAISRGGIWAGNLTGTGDLAVATLGLPNSGAVLPALLQGMRIGAVATAANTTTAPKLRVMNVGTAGGYTDFPILKEDGSAPAVGDIKVGRRYRFEADGAGNVVITGGGLVSITQISQQLLGNIKQTAFSAAQQTALTNNGYVPLIFTDASTADFTNNGANGFTCNTPGLYGIALQGYIFTNVTGQSSNDISELILKNGAQIAAGKLAYPAFGSGTFTENTYALAFVPLAAGDVIKPVGGISVGPPANFGNANAANHQLTFTKMF